MKSIEDLKTIWGDNVDHMIDDDDSECNDGKHLLNPVHPCRQGGGVVRQAHRKGGVGALMMMMMAEMIMMILMITIGVIFLMEKISFGGNDDE